MRVLSVMMAEVELRDEHLIVLRRMLFVIRISLVGLCGSANVYLVFNLRFICVAPLTGSLTFRVVCVCGTIGIKSKGWRWSACPPMIVRFSCGAECTHELQRSR